MRRRLMVMLVVICLFFFEHAKILSAATVDAPKETALYARSAVLMDADSGRILYEKNGSEALANASTTKILTCILALEMGDLTSVVTVSSLAASQPKVRLGVREGQQFYLLDLLYGLMLESYNDCAVAIAEHLAVTVEDFADLMNAKASEIGCEDTYFITPNGLDAEDEDGFHHTTASDLALLMRYCIMQSPQKDRFLEITGTQQYNFTDVGGTSSYSCYNRNAFLSMMSGALSGKTGFTGNAGYCYVGSLCRDGITYIVALLACGWPNNKTYKWSDTKLLMNYGLEAFSLCDLTQYEPERSRLLPILVNHAAGEVIGEEIFVPLKAELVTDLSAMLLSEGEELAVRYEIADTLEAPIEPDAYVGRVTYSLGDEIWKEYRILTAEGAVRIDFFHCLGMVLGLMLP